MVRHENCGRRFARSLPAHLLTAVLVAGLARPPVALAMPEKFLPKVVLAASGPRVAVLAIGVEPKAQLSAGVLEHAAEEAVARASRFELVPVQNAWNPASAKERVAKADEARAKIKDGKKALDDLDNVKATESFVEALAAWKQGDFTTDFNSIVDAWLLKAASHATGGENAPAKKDIEAIVGLKSESEFSSAYFSPDLIKFAEAQKKLAANAKGELTVRTDPPGARVWVDGQYRGTSPVTVAGLTGTKHLVAAVAAGYALTQAELGPGEELLRLEPAELAPAMKTAAALITKDPDGPARDQGAKQLAKALGVDQLLLVVAKKSLAGDQLDVVALRLEARDGHNMSYRAGTVKPGQADELAAFLDGLLAKDDQRDGKDPRTHFKGGGGGGAKTVAGITLLGVGAAAIATGGVFGFMASQRANEWRETQQVQTMKSEQIKAQGQTFAIVADVSIIVGAASAITGGILLLTGRGGGGEEPAPKKETTKKKSKSSDTKSADDAKKREEARKADEKRREDERKADDERKRKEEEDKKAADEAKKKAEEEEKKKAEEEAAKKKAEEERPLSKKERKKREAEEKKREAEEKKRAEAESKKRGDEEAKKKTEEEAAAKKKADEEAAAKKKADEEAAAAKKKADEEAKKKAEEKKKTEDHDDLRNY